MKNIRRVVCLFLTVFMITGLLPSVSKVEASPHTWTSVTSFSSLASMIDSCTSGHLYLRLDKDLSVGTNEAIIISKAVGVDLDLNGHKLNVSMSSEVFEDVLFYVEGNLRISDSKNSGGALNFTRDSQSGFANLAYISRYSAYLVVDSGTLSCSNAWGSAACIHLNGGTYVQNGGEISASSSGFCSYGLYINKGEIDNQVRIDGGKITVNKGDGIALYLKEEEMYSSLRMRINDVSLYNKTGDPEAKLIYLNTADNVFLDEIINNNATIIVSPSDDLQLIYEKSINDYIATAHSQTTMSGTYGNVWPKLVEFVYPDINGSEWYHSAVQYVYNNEIMTGVTHSDGVYFEPYTLIPRAQFVALLYKMSHEGSPDSLNTGLSDVKASDWYAEAVAWAVESKVASGYSDGTFRPLNYISRQEMAIMMCNYAKHKYVDTSKTADLSTFVDGALVPTWAQPALGWAVYADLITGKNNGTTLDPFGNASRAECAVIITKYMKNIITME